MSNNCLCFLKAYIQRAHPCFCDEYLDIEAVNHSVTVDLRASTEFSEEFGDAVCRSDGIEGDGIVMQETTILYKNWFYSQPSVCMVTTCQI